MKVPLLVVLLYALLVVGVLLFPQLARLQLEEDKSARKIAREQEKTQEADDYQPCEQNCSWMSYLSNEEFRRTVDYKAEFGVDDDQQILGMRKSLACVPYTFGYSQSRGKEVFPPFSYPTCESKITEPKPDLDLQPNTQTFNMSCGRGEGKFVVKPKQLDPKEFNLYSTIVDLWEERKFEGETEVNSEYVLGSCGSKYTDAQLIPQFNSSAYRRAQSIISRKSPSAAIRPMIILFLTLDSFSRRHFYRKLPLSTAFLSELNSNGRFSVFDFKLHNIMGRISPENMVPMFWNQTLRERMEPYEGDALGEYAIWAMLKERGFVVATGFENCGSDFINFIGKTQNVDHFVNAFYCAARKFAGVAVDKTSIEQRCIGPRMSHSYILNYTRTFSRLYEGVNQFVYFHIDTAHEQTGQHAALLDYDLKEFLEQFMEEFAEKNDVSIFLQADHGMRYGAWHTDLEAEQEMKLPALFFLTQTALLDRIPHSYDSLWHNTFRLVTKRDLRATILSLGDLPFNLTFDRKKQEEYLKEAVVLFTEKAPDSRTCSGVHIAPWNCGCLNSPISVSMNKTSSRLIRHQQKLVRSVALEALRVANREVFTPTHLPPGIVCRKLTFERVIRAYLYLLDEFTVQIRVEFAVKESQTARFETLALVSAERSGAMEMVLMEAETQQMEFEGVDVGAKILYTSRKDRYAGPCERLSKANFLRAEFCLCPDLEAFAEDYPGLTPDSL